MTCKSTQKRIAIQTDTITLPITEYEQLVADKERLDALDALCYGYGFEETHEGNEWKIYGPFNTVRDALDVEIDQAIKDKL